MKNHPIRTALFTALLMTAVRASAQMLNPYIPVYNPYMSGQAYVPGYQPSFTADPLIAQANAIIADNRNFINWVYANNWQGRPYATMDQAMEMGGGQGLQDMVNWRMQWMNTATPAQMRAYEMGIARMEAYNQAQHAIMQAHQDAEIAYARRNGYLSYEQYKKASQEGLKRIERGKDTFINPRTGNGYRIDKNGDMRCIRW